MNLLDLMANGDDLREKALDRLEGIIALYQSDEEDVQDEALARAITLCGKEWGGYKQGLEELALRVEQAASDPLEGELAALTLREEGDDPGCMIRVARHRRSLEHRQDVARDAIIARYGSIDVAMGATPVERMFIDATRSLAELSDGEVEEEWAPLAGWSVPWHEVPWVLVEALSAVCPLPTTIADARAEYMAWEERRRERQLLTDGPGTAALPTACAARHKLVEDLWRRGLPAQTGADIEARLEYWATRGGDDGTGYAILRDDLFRVLASEGLSRPQEGTRDKIRRLKNVHPDWSLARIGKELGISRQAVHKHLKR